MRTLHLGLLALAVAAGCGSPPPIPAAVQAHLRRAQSCGDLEQALKADALRKMNDAIDRNIASLRYWDVWGYGSGGTLGAEPPSARDNGGAAQDSASTYSTTNDQVKGVDEADFVKNDGKYIYLLHGQNFEVIQAWPAPQMTQASSISIEGYPQEMFVDSGKVVVFSAVNPQPILDAAGIKQRPYYYDYMGYGFADAGGGNVRGGAPAVDIACFPGQPCGGYWGGFTKITVLQLDANEQPSVVSESWFEGSYLSSRKIGTRVRAVINGGAHGPQVDYWPSDLYQQHASDPNWRPSRGDMQAAYERLRAKNTQIINSSTVADWLPYTFTRANGGITAQLEKCENYYVPTEGSTAWGLTQISSLDLAAPSAPDFSAIVGETDVVYSSLDHMVLASRGWMPYAWYWGWDSPPDGVTLDYTHLHSFNLDADPRIPTYEGSGTIPGQIVDQFSLDENNGIIRVTSTEHQTKRVVTSSNPFQNSTSFQETSLNHLYTLQPNGDRLVQIGDAGVLAAGERIQSTRFVGNRGYVTTFRQVDPLFVVDLKDAAHPTVLGSLTIPGFSSYMQPMDDTHLLTIGRDVDPNTNRQGGLMLQIFDVTNATGPALVQKYVYDDSAWGYSEAQYDHKAFNYFPDKKMLAFPYYGYNTTSARSTAELFKIDVQAGIQKLGSVDHSAFIGTSYQGWCGGYFSPSVRRTVFMDTVLYSISYGGVIATDTTNMASLAQLPLAAPRIEGYAACY